MPPRSAVRQPGRIADQEDSIGQGHRHRRVVQAVGVALEGGGGTGRQAPCRAQPVAEALHVAGEIVRIVAAQSHVDEVPLADDPAVAGEVVAEVDLGTPPTTAPASSEPTGNSASWRG